MARDRVVLCGDAPGRGVGSGASPVALRIYGRQPNVRFRLEEVRRAVWRDIPPVLRDLLDLAVYVYSADAAVPRSGGGRVDGGEIGAGWRRNFLFRIPVRELDLWQSDEVRDALVSTLSFLSEDEYTFEFSPLRKDLSLDGFIDFDATPFDGRVDEVVMFSGGLDSLAGAVTEAVAGKRQVLLVNHRPSEKTARRHADLLRRLAAHAGDRNPLHFPVRVNKEKALGKEYTQRTRSFLFAALGATFARMTGLDRLRFYENGVVSLNLPPSAQVVGARASRTTHPRVLAGFGRLLTAVLGRPFAVENPFQWDTKADVVRRLAAAGCGDLIGLSTSCGHTWARTRGQTHCGVCSQCIDRRFAVLAAGQGANDPADAYAVDLLTGPRAAGEPAVMLTGYVDLAQRVEGMGEADFFGHFGGELARALPHLGTTTRVGATRAFDLYQRHAREVAGVLNRALADNADAVRRRALPRDCLLRLVYEEGGPAEEAEPPASLLPEGNYFVRREGFWAVRFGGGEERVYPAGQGFEYLGILLQSPGTSHSAASLASAVHRGAGTEMPRVATAADAVAAGAGLAGSAGGDAALDAVAVGHLRSRLEQIQEQRRLVEASDSPTRLDDVDELDAEERAIRERLRLDCGLNGQPRELGDLRNRDRNRVCNAIRRAVERIALYDSPLAAHLKSPVLNLGHTLSYVPRDDVRWTVRG